MKSYKLNNTDLDLVLTNKKACIKNNDINDKLIKTKKKIDEFPEQWEKYKKHYNKYEYIYISNNSKKNICKINPISRSFFKLHEIIKDYDLLYNKNKNKNTIIKEYIIQNIYIYSIHKEFYFFKKTKEDYVLISPFSFYEVDKENTYIIK